MDYKPATAILTTYRTRRSDSHQRADPRRQVLIKPEALPELLSKIADLISRRAARIVERQLRQS